MPENEPPPPENYWREALRRHMIAAAKEAEREPPALLWIEEISEARAQQCLEALESIKTMVDNFVLLRTGR